MQVVAVDPGKHVGIALFVDGELKYCETILCPCSDITLCRMVNKVLWLSPYPTVVVLENFIMANYVGQNLEAFHQIGALIYACKSHMIPLVKQTPKMRKPFDGAAKVLKMHKTPHELSAIAHGLCYLSKNEVQ